MKVTNVLLGVGAAIALVVIYKKFIAPAPKEPTAAQKLGGGLTDIITGGKSFVDGIGSFFGGATAPKPAPSPDRVAIGDVMTWDADGDQNGATPTGVIEFRAMA